MPHPKGNVKLSGDIHLPDAESDLAIENGHTGMEALAHERTQPGRTGRARKAGLLIDPDLGSTDRLSHVTRGEPIEPGTAPLAGYASTAPQRQHQRPSLQKMGFAFLGLVLLYKLARR
jgi:hypothetical protein